MDSDIVNLDVEFRHAAMAGKINEMKKLLEKGVNINTRTEPYKNTPLMLAASVGNTETVKFLLNSGACINIKDKVLQANALFYAIISGNYETAKLLIENKANLNSKNYEKDTVLTYLCKLNQKCQNRNRLVQLLLENGVNLHTTDKNGDTAFYIAAKNKDFNIAYLLLSLDPTLHVRHCKKFLASI